jgi:putative ABC transport system permease protein
MWISLFVIILIVAVGVLNTVLMSVLERTREYGVLKALGSRPAQVFQLVMFEVAIMAAGSIVIGTCLSLLGNYLLSIYGISMPQALTYGGIEFKTMYAEINMRSLVIPGVTVLVAALLVAMFPALRAAHTDPARSMRHH